MATFVPPAPVSNCDACNDPGWYAGASLLYLQSYGDGVGGDNGSGGSTFDGEWDFGARGTLGFERPDGLFAEINGFWYEGDYDYDSDGGEGSFSAELTTWYVEALVGDNLHCGESCLDYSFGLRYGNLEKEEREIDGNFDGAEGYEFEGIGPVVRLDGTRRLSDTISLYAGISQAILFGEAEEKRSFSFSPTAPPDVNKSDSDQVAFVTELEGGLQFDLNLGGLQNAYVRLGLEAQYWAIDETDNGLFGGVLGAGFAF